ncbi:hypothetical protein [Solirubrobacter soli]|uniref:hypothetical protein n=1 Tax=Solirubrobacter soli TaxID=363832 RepID=UPI0003FCB1BB|nr:hypothetical protein [Solirubrobacter soli]
MGAAALALVAVPFAKAQTGDAPRAQAAAIAAGDPLRAEVRNGTTAKETEIIGQFNATTGSKGGYVTRQSNTQTGSKAGGGAIYGCRGAAGGTASGSAPCLRSVNLAAGYAFEFSTAGGVAGLIAVGDGKTPSPSARPFTTNANGVATGLNADRVDGQDASDIAATPGPPSGTAGGALSGTYPNPQLAANALGVAVGGVKVDSGGTLGAAFNRRGGIPTVTHNGTGSYTVTFPGFSADDALPQVTLVGAAFGETRATTSGGAVQVFTADSAGTLADRGFALTLFSTGA